MLAEADFQDSETKDYDSLLECGVNLGDKEPKEIFSESAPDTNQGFGIGYYSNNEFIYGLSDEDSKINLSSVALAMLLEKKE